MVKIKCFCLLEGQHFFPSSLIIPKILSTVYILNHGDTILVGKHYGKKSDNGSIILSGDIDNVLDFLIQIKSNGILESINTFDIYINVSYINQCNFELTSAQLQRLSILNTSFGISCYESEDENFENLSAVSALLS
jgi:hypothetical protein